MRSTQWFILGIFFILVSLWFIQLDKPWNLSCNIFDDSSQLQKADIMACVSSEVLDPFIWLLFPLGVVFNICGWIESRAEKKRKPK